MHNTKNKTKTHPGHLGRKRELPEFECAALLQRIIDRSEGKLQDAYKYVPNAIKLMCENGKLLYALQKAWGTKYCKEIWEIR